MKRICRRAALSHHSHSLTFTHTMADHDERIALLSSLLVDLTSLIVRLDLSRSGRIDLDRLEEYHEDDYKRIVGPASQGPWIITTHIFCGFDTVMWTTRELDVCGLRVATTQHLHTARADRKAHTLACMQELAPHLHQVNVLVALVGSYLCKDIQVPNF